MNERIDELLKQSRTEYWTQYTPSYDYEKFAELIIMDVANKLEPVLASEILELYGVEE
jgi:hypothetical protein